MCPLNNPSISNARIVKSSYTGNASGGSRQITTGFACKFVQIYDRANNKLCLTNDTTEGGIFNLGGASVNTTACNLHATDGFNVGGAANEMNAAATDYYYTAIG